MEQIATDLRGCCAAWKLRHIGRCGPHTVGVSWWWARLGIVGTVPGVWWATTEAASTGRVPARVDD